MRFGGPIHVEDQSFSCPEDQFLCPRKLFIIKPYSLTQQPLSKMLPVDTHQVHVRFYVVSHSLWDAMSKPHLLKILIAILAQMQRVSPPGTKLIYVNLYIFD